MSLWRYIALLLFTIPRWGEAQYILAHDDMRYLAEALHALNMNLDDLGFEKDVGEPAWAFSGIRNMLADPIALTGLGDDLIHASRDPAPERLWALIVSLLEIEYDNADRDGQPMEWDRQSVTDESLSAALDAFLRAASSASGLLERAFQPLSVEDKAYLAAAHLAGAINAEDRSEARRALINIGVSDAIIERVIVEHNEIDPEPAIRRQMDLANRIDRDLLMAAGRVMIHAAHELMTSATTVSHWPDEAVVIETELGRIVIGTRGDDVYEETALLILDPGGRNSYRAGVGVANSLVGQAISVIIDLDGHDSYRSDDLLGAGTALFGVCVVLDISGDDLYSAAYMGQGSGLFGMGWLEDHGGNDLYRAGLFSQGAGVHGVGVLRDVTGNDLYDVGLCGQAYAGTLGVGLLIDYAGDDLYRAGGRERDHERHPDRYLSLSQGFSIGHRPFVGGGYAALIDFSGNDTYIADVFGQGASYWYSAGILLDLEGQDTYSVHHYGQGAGIHMSLGLLYDGAGNDMYSGHILAQGSAHDYGVGLLIDHGGHNTFTGDHHVQGRAINNSLAILLNRGGDDAYFAAQPLRAQGIGNDGDRREYGSISLLVDPDGRNTYSQTVRDGEIRVRPSHGVIFNATLEQDDEK